MKQVELKELRLQNFKGIRDRMITFNGNTNILGANASCKSTIFDAYTWLLFGKDQFDRENHEIKTLDSNNRPIHHLDHEVEATFVIDGVEERPKRVYKEKWVKKKGEPLPAFDGHEVLYFWNDVPKKAGEYKAMVDAILSEEMFKLLSNTLYFNTNAKLGWQGRRAILMNIAGEITNEDISAKSSASKTEMDKVLKVLSAYKSIEDFKKTNAVQKKKVKDQLSEIPTRISEAQRSKPEAFDFSGIEKQIEIKLHQITVLEMSLSDAVKSQSMVNQLLLNKQSNLHKLESDLLNIKYAVRSTIQGEQNAGANNVYQADQQLKSLNNNISVKEQAISTHINLKTSNLNAIIENNTKLSKLREDWAAIDAETFVFDDTACVCPTCKQMLQENDIEVKKQELLGNFNTSKLARLTDVVNKGNRIKEDTANIEKSIGIIDAQIADLQAELQTLKSQLPSLKTKLDTAKLIEANKGSFDIEAAITERMATNTDAINLNVLIQNAKAEIEASKNTATVSNNDELKQQRSVLQNELDLLKNQFSNKAIIEKTDVRITELERQEGELSQQLADLEQIEFGIEKYTKAKMDILESRINSRFQYVTFKLFDRQINGGEVECCECLVSGVPFSVVNTAARINAGLDIINVLCDHYGITCPVFIDNRESVSNIIETKSQIINLIVNPEHKTLFVQAA